MNGERDVTSALDRARQDIVEASRYVHERGLTHGSTGNISVRVDELIVVTPTGKSLRSLVPQDLAVVDLDGAVRSETKPSKEAVLHAALYRARTDLQAVIHTHSLYSTAVSCLQELDDEDVLPQMTAYYAMRVGRLPLIPFYPPGDPELAAHAGRVAKDSHALLMRNHGPIAGGTTLDHALDVIEEIEKTAQLYLLLNGRAILPVDSDAAKRLYKRAKI